MVTRRRSSKDTVSGGNSNFRSLIFEKLLRELIFVVQQSRGVKKGVKFRDIGQIRRNSLNFLPAKMSSLKELFSASQMGSLHSWGSQAISNR